MRIFFLWLIGMNFVLPTWTAEKIDDWADEHIELFWGKPPEIWPSFILEDFRPVRHSSPSPQQEPDFLGPFRNKPLTINSRVEENLEWVSGGDLNKGLLHQQCDVIFEKLTQSIRDNLVPATYAIGLDYARRYIHLRIDYPNLNQPVPELTAIAQEILASLGPGLLMTIDDQTLLSWNTFRELITEMVNRKNNNDVIDAAKDLNRLPQLEVIRKFEAKLTLDRPGMPEVFPAFITAPNGILGEAIFLITIAFDVALYGVPTQGGMFKADNYMCTTAGFVNHDSKHLCDLLLQRPATAHIKAPISKFDIIRSGRFRSFLTEVAYTEINIRGLFLELREGEFHPLSFWSENPDYGVKFFRVCLDPNTGLSDEEITEVIKASKNYYIDYGHGPFFGKHAARDDDAEAYMTGKKEPSTELLKKMKSWGLLYDPCAYTRDFLYLLSLLERADAELWRRLDEAHELKMLSNITVLSPHNLFFIGQIINLLNKNFEQVKQGYLNNKDTILQQNTWKGRYDAFYDEVRRRK